MAAAVAPLLHAYVAGCENSTATWRTGASGAGRDQRSAAANNTGSPGTACGAENPATQRRTRARPLPPLAAAAQV